jgi:hypothetical protein
MDAQERFCRNLCKFGKYAKNLDGHIQLFDMGLPPIE